MKKYFLIILSLVLISFIGCNSSKLELSEIDKSMSISKMTSEKSYHCKDEAEINIVVTAINDSKKAPSKIVKKIKEDSISNPNFLLTFIHKDRYKRVYSVWIKDKDYVIAGAGIGYRLIKDKDVAEFEKILNKSINP